MAGDPITYNLSFTAAALRLELAQVVAQHYRTAGFWACRNPPRIPLLLP